jgi:hypothetical protein
MTYNTKSNLRAVLHDLVELERSTSLTKQGKNWLIQALDPFHDTDIPPTGFPDANIGGSIVQEVKSSIQISAPSSVTSGTWDLHAFNLSNMLAGYLYQGGFLAGFTAAASTPVTAGGVVVLTGPTGTALNLSNIGSNVNVTSLSLPFDYLTGSSRIVAMGFEGVNTTSDLYRQGLVTVYRQPQPSVQVVNYPTKFGTVTGQTNMYLCNDAPSSIDQAMLLEGSRQWKAADGSYSVVTLSSVDCPARQLTNASGVYLTETLLDAVATQCAFSWAVNSSGTPIYLDNHNFNMSGAYYTGLSLQTTITINVVYYIERFPSCFNSTLAVLTSPSIPYDSMALELYARAMTGMPPGVPQYENGLGEWFRDVIDGIRPALALAGNTLSAIPNPYAQVGGTIASALSQVAPNPPPRPQGQSSGRVPPGQVYQPGSVFMPKTSRKAKRARRRVPKNSQQSGYMIASS